MKRDIWDPVQWNCKLADKAHTHTHTHLFTLVRSFPSLHAAMLLHCTTWWEALAAEVTTIWLLPCKSMRNHQVLGKEPWISHTQNGTRLPVCVRMCICRSVVPWNSLLQCWQLYFFLRFTCPACARKCSRRLSLRLNMRPHTCRQIQAIFWDVSPDTCVNVHLSPKLTLC